MTAVLLLLIPAIGVPQQKPSAFATGEGWLDAYLRQETAHVADACLSDVKTREDWENRRPELRRQFLEMMGLWPLPPRTDLKATITGKLAREQFSVEKIHFQSVPGLYVTGNLYIPKKTVFPAPTILYVCGHSPVVIGDVPYGCKVAYQHHAHWFASNGYVCLVLDTLQLGEVPGLHHGTSKFNMWWWQTLGYTPAGIELWNAMRALDYLQTRPEVDPTRFGVTGRSGGGATSWWVGAADERVQCIVPVAGIADLRAHVVEGLTPRYRRGVVEGHCDCMYFSNTYRWDYPMLAALCAPRPLLLGNSDADDIFPVPGYRRLADKAMPVYKLYHAPDRFTLLETKGPHKDTPELRHGAYGWMNRWLKKSDEPIHEDEPKRFSAQELKVFSQVPADAINGTIHETFLKAAHPQLPQSSEVGREWWKGQRDTWMRILEDQVFRGWPKQAPQLDLKPAGDVTQHGIRVRAWDFVSESGAPLRLWLTTAQDAEKVKLIILTAVDEKAWQDWTRTLGPDFKEVLQEDRPIALDSKASANQLKLIRAQQCALATIAPRGIGPTRWAEENSTREIHNRRRFALLGQTEDGQRVWDVRRALAALQALPQSKGLPVTLQGERLAAGWLLYASLFEPSVQQLNLFDIPTSHVQGPTFLNVRRFLDLPQAVALALPKQIRINLKSDAQLKEWDWPRQLQRLLGVESLKISSASD